MGHRFIRHAFAYLFLLAMAMAGTSPAYARFVSADPVTVEQSGDARHFNRYAYAYNNPFRFTDPDGRSGLDWSHRYRATLDMAGGDVDLANRYIAEGMATGLEAASAVAGPAGLLRAGAARAVPRVAGKVAADPAHANKLRHVFGDKDHNLGALSQRLGGDAKTLRAIEKAARKATKGRKDGVFEEAVEVAGETVTVRGFVIRGETRLGTAFIKKEHVRAVE